MNYVRARENWHARGGELPRAVRSETRRKDLFFSHLTACHVLSGGDFYALAYFVRYYSPEGHETDYS